MVTWKVFLLLKTYKRNWALLKHINYENMTDFRKTVETGVDPRLFCEGSGDYGGVWVVS